MAWTAPKQITFQREPLYNEVWSEPMTKLAAKYGLSDNGLRKVCLALDIPVPARGHWARLAAGLPVERMPLPESAERTTFIARPPARGPERQFRSEDDERWLADRLAREAQEDLRIVVDPTPTKWHPQLRDLRARLQADEAQYHKEVAAYQREQARRSRARRAASRPDFSFFSTLRARSGGFLLETHHAFPLRVTAGTWRAAMALVNTIFFAAEKRGVTPTLDEKKGRFFLGLEQADVSFAVREPLDEDWIEEFDWYGKPQRERISKGSGRLFIAAYKNGYGYDYRKFLADESGDFGNLSEILFAPLYRNVVKQREERRAQAEQERQQELERQRQLALQASAQPKSSAGVNSPAWPPLSGTARPSCSRRHAPGRQWRPFAATSRPGPRQARRRPRRSGWPGRGPSPSSSTRCHVRAPAATAASTASPEPRPLPHYSERSGTPLPRPGLTPRRSGTG